MMGAVFLVGAVVWAGYTFLRQADELKAFTDTDPAPLAEFSPAPGALAALQSRLTSFAEATTAGHPAELALSVDDLNTMLTGFPRLADVKPLLRVRQLGPDATFSLDIRFPMNALPGHRRFLNGEMDGRFSVHPEAGLFISVLDVRVPGRTVPPGFIEVYQRGIIPGKNFGFLDSMLMRNFREDPGFAPTLIRVAAVDTRDHHLVIRNTTAETNPPPPDASPPTPSANQEAGKKN